MEKSEKLKELIFPEEKGRQKLSHDCDVCKKSFSQKAYLNKHKRIHTGEKPFHCDICGKSFFQKGSLTSHKRLHKGEKTYHCNVCGTSFSDQSILTTHIRVHTGEKPYHCNICGKSFSKSITLTKHKCIHTGQKPFDCDICGKSFSRNYNLTVHKRIHTGEKPCHCDVCGKSFCQSDSLATHKREKPDRCGVCGKSFSSASLFITHKRIHTGKNPFHCDVYGYPLHIYSDNVYFYVLFRRHSILICYDLYGEMKWQWELPFPVHPHIAVFQGTLYVPDTQLNRVLLYKYQDRSSGCCLPIKNPYIRNLNLRLKEKENDQKIVIGEICNLSNGQLMVSDIKHDCLLYISEEGDIVSRLSLPSTATDIYVVDIDGGIWECREEVCCGEVKVAVELEMVFYDIVVTPGGDIVVVKMEE
ncbi:XP_036371110.1uncharacterized protein LOC118768538 isoform X2 [Octopus vulgaris]|uniref:XP_036371110.1uncharacterized protein LOC118768538 isoform X2 n=1 Tax=Octopus vulgaris TaxID=6645 RepID=A0AA36FKZ1_OCTVU|nr:XP_036371110.1uncharacterized protein LOC118768538 isoform X2 [Octopus vulgaris]